MLNKKLFRAKNNCNEWVYGSLIEDYSTGKFYILENKPNDMNYPFIDSVTGVIDGHITPVRKETICQYIEQMSWRGLDFYEGDIVRCTWAKSGKIFGTGTAIVVSDRCIIEDGYGRVFPQDTLEYEIIGNVIDNLDLLSERSIRWVKNYGWLREEELKI